MDFGDRSSPEPPMLRRYLDRGFTYAEISEDWERQTGVRVGPNSIRRAVLSAGLSPPEPPKPAAPAETPQVPPILAERDWVLPDGTRLRDRT